MLASQALLRADTAKLTDAEKLQVVEFCWIQLLYAAILEALRKGQVLQLCLARIAMENLQLMRRSELLVSPHNVHQMTVQFQLMAAKKAGIHCGPENLAPLKPSSR